MAAPRVPHMGIEAKVDDNGDLVWTEEMAYHKNHGKKVPVRCRTCPRVLGRTCYFFFLEAACNTADEITVGHEKNRADFTKGCKATPAHDVYCSYKCAVESYLNY